MKAAIVAIIGAFTLAVSVVNAAAQNSYAGIYLGANYAHDGDIVEAGLAFDGSYDLGYAVGGFVGRRFAYDYRIEGELTYRTNGVDSVGFGGIDLPAGGDVNSLALMVNVYRDFYFATFRPYIGGGIGAAYATIDNFSLAGTPVADESDTVFAYQLAVGVGIPVGSTVDLTLDYRLFGTSDIGVTELPPFTGTPLEFQYLNSSFMVGLRKTF